ncbi:hypothetical protein [Lewinella cohaerens]|nr:hypothetical protein [Lewinella cohaerens]
MRCHLLSCRFLVITINSEIVLGRRWVIGGKESALAEMVIHPA